MIIIDIDLLEEVGAYIVKTLYPIGSSDLKDLESWGKKKKCD